MLQALQSIDPIFLLAVPATLWQGAYWQNKRDAAARLEAMRRHPAGRRR